MIIRPESGAGRGKYMEKELSASISPYSIFSVAIIVIAVLVYLKFAHPFLVT